MILAFMKYFICNFTKTFVFLLTLPLTFCHLLHLSHWHNGWQRSCSECGRSPESSSSSSSSLEPSLNRTCQIREQFHRLLSLLQQDVPVFQTQEIHWLKECLWKWREGWHLSPPLQTNGWGPCSRVDFFPSSLRDVNVCGWTVKASINILRCFQN